MDHNHFTSAVLSLNKMVMVKDPERICCVELQQEESCDVKKVACSESTSMLARIRLMETLLDESEREKTRLRRELAASRSSDAAIPVQTALAGALKEMDLENGGPLQVLLSPSFHELRGIDEIEAKMTKHGAKRALEAETLFPAVFDSNTAVSKLQSWFFSEGFLFKDVPSLLDGYCQLVRKELGIPLDRFEMDYLQLVDDHIESSEPIGLVWTWEHEKKDQMMDRIHLSGHDHYALPLKSHQGELIGDLSWSSKSGCGFSLEHLDFFCSSLSDFSAMLYMHINSVNQKVRNRQLTEQVNQLSTALASSTANLEQAHKQKLEQCKAQLKHFACMCHEIRTPLNGIIGMTNILLDDDSSSLAPVHAQSIQMISDCGDLLLAIINDVLDFSRMQCGSTAIQCTSCSVQDTVEKVVRLLQPVACNKNVQLHSTYSAEIPSFIQMDGRRLQQILFNLLGNAVKFSESNGDVFVEASLCPPAHDQDDEDASSDTLLRLKIKDFGRGIDRKNFSKIFQAFSEVTEETQPRYGGSGLGLAITSQLVKALGGTISVDSELGQWTEFVVTLPCHSCEKDIPDDDDQTCSLHIDDEDSDLLEFSSNINDKNLEANPHHFPVRVLIAEDNKINQKILQSTLSRLGIRIIDLVENGQDAVDAVESNDYDLVFMDMEMPVMDGLDACRVIREQSQDKPARPPLVYFVTAHAMDSMLQEQVAHVGGNGILCKPFKALQIQDILRKLDAS